MVNVPSLRDLRAFLDPRGRKSHHLLSMPALYHVYTSTTPFNEFISVLVWIEETARTTINALNVETPLNPPSTDFTEDDWIQVWTNNFRISPLTNPL